MPNSASTFQRETAQFPGLLLLAAISLLASGGLTVWWVQRESPHAEAPAASVRSPRVIPRPPDEGALHSVTTGVEHGVQVIKIRVSAGGDELVVDAKTGRLIEARPRRPSGPALRPGFLAPQGEPNQPERSERIRAESAPLAERVPHDFGVRSSVLYSRNKLADRFPSRAVRGSPKVGRRRVSGHQGN